MCIAGNYSFAAWVDNDEMIRRHEYRVVSKGDSFRVESRYVDTMKDGSEKVYCDWIGHDDLFCNEFDAYIDIAYELLGSCRTINVQNEKMSDALAETKRRIRKLTRLHDLDRTLGNIKLKMSDTIIFGQQVTYMEQFQRLYEEALKKKRLHKAAMQSIASQHKIDAIKKEVFAAYNKKIEKAARVVKKIENRLDRNSSK